MDTLRLQPALTRASTTPEFERLYRAWRYAKAQWELADNDPATDGLTQDETDAFCDKEHAALLAFLYHPAATAAELARKLRVMRDEQGWGYTAAPEIVARLFRDANTIAFGHSGD